MPSLHMSDDSMWKRVTKPNGEDGCWVWTGAFANGYGKLPRDGQSVYAHRLLWSLANRQPMPKWPSVLLHSCDNSKCVNPAHLRLGTQRENAHDRDGKTRQARGERAGSAKLTTAKVLEIRALYAIGQSQAVIAKQFGVGRVAVSNVVTGRTWAHVP